MQLKLILKICISASAALVSGLVFFMLTHLWLVSTLVALVIGCGVFHMTQARVSQKASRVSIRYAQQVRTKMNCCLYLIKNDTTDIQTKRAACTDYLSYYKILESCADQKLPLDEKQMIEAFLKESKE